MTRDEAIEGDVAGLLEQASDVLGKRCPWRDTEGHDMVYRLAYWAAKLKGAALAARGHAGEPPRIVVEHVRPPIPIRDFDWCATFEDYEPGDPQGEGATKQAAIDDLMSKADDGLREKA